MWWDLDDDGSFNDAFGATASLPDISPGSHAVRVEASYPDGDRALAREVITTAGSPLPQPPPQPPPPPEPAPAPAPAPPRAAAATTGTEDTPPAPASASSVASGPLDAASPPAALARLLPGSKRLRVRSLLDRRTSIGVACSAACRLGARLTLDGRTARALGLGRSVAAVLIGSGQRQAAANRSVRLTIRLTKKAVRALRRAVGGRLRVRVTATAGARSQRLERTLKLVV